MASDDLVRQQDELTVLSEIFTSDEFTTFVENNDVSVVFKAHIELPKNFLLCLSQDESQTNFPVLHLPPICLVAYLPHDYPSKNAPYFTLSCSWLSKTKLKILVQKLQSLWERSSCEILFIWYSFLKDQSLELLNISHSYDLNEKFTFDVNKVDPTLEKQNICSIVDQQTLSYVGKRDKSRSTYNKKANGYGSKQKTLDENQLLRIKAKEKLSKLSYDQVVSYHRDSLKPLYYSIIEYNALKVSEDFKRTMQECNVCFASALGESCKQLSCGHVTCVECLKRMCEVHIRHGTMDSIKCVEENCGLEIAINMIKELVSQELYEKFDRLMLNRTLDIISQVYCPRINCQYPISSQGEDSLAICPSCDHAFCIFCKRPYHGVEGCKLKNEEKKELIAAYQNANIEKKLELEKRYGKKQLTELVNNAQSELWMEENSKPCPCCHVKIEKNDGCNKMICRKCNANFCWICLKRVSSLNPYLHFQDRSSKCFNLLFEGANEAFDDNEGFAFEENQEEDEDDIVMFV